MASTSTSTPYSRGAPVVLPSIHDMFPQHFLPRSAVRTPAPSISALAPRPARATSRLVPPQDSYPSFSFDILKCNPHGSSLEHIASSRPVPLHRSSSRSAVRAQSRPRLNPRLHSPLDNNFRAQSVSASDGDAEGEATDDGEEGEGGPEDMKKHVCPTCGKRFNRPSSLRIHVNTHTGATPFRCPHPSCGRAFNVNSNMRRHFRNHAFATSNANSPSSTTNLVDDSRMFKNSHPTSYAPPTPPLMLRTSFPSASIAYENIPSLSPSSPPSASWSVSSFSSEGRSPVTPAMEHNDAGFSPAWEDKRDRQRAGYVESDVRSSR
ncbi:hypothetical protein DFH06DRAFT_1222116 [Mycena polygramma]|nr:hypothetical protein DFH06DRAFT_1222116 [Mycena polygramma]